MDKRDIELKLLSKKPIVVDRVPIYPISIDDISSIGFMRYNSELRLLCLNKDDVQSLLGKDISQVGVYGYLVGNALNDTELMNMIIFWFSILTHEEITFQIETFSFMVGNNVAVINMNNFDEIQSIIRSRNGLVDYEDEIDNPANEAAKKLLERRKEERMKRKKARKQGDNDDSDDGLNLSDLVSILASGLRLPLSSVMDYDIYQFNNQFNRLKIIDDYEVSVQALLHGAKKDDIHFTHWITKIKPPEQ